MTQLSQRKNFPEYNPGTIISNKEKQLDCQELKKNLSIKENIKLNTKEIKREEFKENKEKKEVNQLHHKKRILKKRINKNKNPKINKKRKLKSNPNFLNSNWRKRWSQSENENTLKSIKK